MCVDVKLFWEDHLIHSKDSAQRVKAYSLFEHMSTCFYPLKSALLLIFRTSVCKTASIGEDCQVSFCLISKSLLASELFDTCSATSATVSTSQHTVETKITNMSL